MHSSVRLLHSPKASQGRETLFGANARRLPGISQHPALLPALSGLIPTAERFLQPGCGSQPHTVVGTMGFPTTCIALWPWGAPRALPRGAVWAMRARRRSQGSGTAPGAGTSVASLAKGLSPLRIIELGCPGYLQLHPAPPCQTQPSPRPLPWPECPPTATRSVQLTRSVAARLLRHVSGKVPANAFMPHLSSSENASGQPRQRLLLVPVSRGACPALPNCWLCFLARQRCRAPSAGWLRWGLCPACDRAMQKGSPVFSPLALLERCQVKCYRNQNALCPGGAVLSRAERGS